MVFETEELDVAADGDGDNRVANVFEFVRGVAARDAGGDEVGVDEAAVGTLDGVGGIIFGEEDALDLTGFEGLQHPF